MKNKQSTSLIIKATMLLLALIVMVFVGTIAWFSSTSTPSVAEGVSISSSSSVEFEMAVGFQSSVNGYSYTMSEYTKNLNLRDIVTVDDEHYDALHDFSPIDVTGDGVTLIRPSMTTKNADIDRTSSVYTTVTPNKEYISFDMYFRSSKPCKVYLDSGSFVKGAIEDTPGDGKLIQTTDNGSNRKAVEGNYSKDAVVGAVRVAFVNYSQFVEGDDTANRLATPRLLWLPRPDIHLNTDGPTGSWSLSTGLTPDNTITDFYGATDKFMGIPADTYKHHYYAFVRNENNELEGMDLNYDKTVTDPSRDAICDVDIQNGDYYYGKTQVNIWIEGCDAEARRTIAGGKFLVNFDLAGG